MKPSIDLLDFQVDQLTPLGLYLHLPWCPSRCIYCDFNTYVSDNSGLKARYRAALLREIRDSGAALGRPALDTIYIGGGTPTTLTPDQLVELVEAAQAAFDLQPGAEITVEANPGTLSPVYLQEIRQGGINRLSLGVQSFRNDELRFLSRRHDASIARQTVDQARRAGFENLNLDLIFNLPQQTVAAWQFNLEEAIRLAPEHLSLYSLMVEQGTPLHRQVEQGQIPAPDDDVAAEMYACAMDTLGAAGYAQYEISNWAKTGGEAGCQTPRLAAVHNLIYWRNQPYLGLGAGACATISGQRWMNVKRPETYIRHVETGAGLGLARDKNSFERIDPPTASREHMLLGLRLLREGVGAGDFENRFGMPLAKAFAEAIAYGLDRRWLEWVEAGDGPHLRLSRPGYFLANQAIIPFM